MKRVFILIVGFFILVYLSSCSNSDKQGFYGRYTFEQVSYLSPLSSVTIDYVNGLMAETKYTIEKDLFKVESAENTVEFRSPNYVKEEIQNDSSILSDVKKIIGNEVEYQYTIYDKDENKTKWRLYISSDYIWIGTYVDNTVDGSEIIMDIYKLSK